MGLARVGALVVEPHGSYATAPPAARKDDLSEQKMREIYAKYVGAKRAANESTAGITYDKLASSLRAALEKPKEQRTEEEKRLAKDADDQIKVTWDELKLYQAAMQV